MEAGVGGPAVGLLRDAEGIGDAEEGVPAGRGPGAAGPEGWSPGPVEMGVVVPGLGEGVGEGKVCGRTGKGARYQGGHGHG